MPPNDLPPGPASILVPIDRFVPCPLNPRKRPQGIAELAADVKARGVLVPLLVRPSKGEAFEIAAGERRWLAAKEAGLAELPAMVRELSDVDIIELGVRENMQRNDLSAVEEADAFAELEKRKRSIEQIASIAGRSPQYIRQRLRLRQLAPGIRELLVGEKIDVGAALVIVQFPDATQKKMLTSLSHAAKGQVWTGNEKGQADAGRITKAEVQRIVRDVAHALADASFDPEDETLVAGAGRCSTCPRQTGRQGVLFEVMDAASVCLDDGCWSQKQRADWERKSEDAKKRGLTVLTPEQSKKVVRHGRAYDAKLVATDEEVWTGSKQVPVAKLVDDSTPRTLALCPDTGRVVELVPKADVEKATAVAKKDAKRAKRSKSEADAAKKQAEKERHRKAVNDRLQRLVQATIVGAINSGRLPVIRALRLLIGNGYKELRPVVERRGLELPPATKNGMHSPAELAIAQEAVRLSEIKDEKLAVRNLVALFCEIEFLGEVSLGGYAENTKTPDELLPFGVDFAKLKKVAEQELKDEAKAKGDKASATKIVAGVAQKRLPPKIRKQLETEVAKGGKNAKVAAAALAAHAKPRTKARKK